MSDKFSPIDNIFQLEEIYSLEDYNEYLMMNSCSTKIDNANISNNNNSSYFRAMFQVANKSKEIIMKKQNSIKTYTILKIIYGENFMKILVKNKENYQPDWIISKINSAEDIKGFIKIKLKITEFPLNNFTLQKVPQGETDSEKVYQLIPIKGNNSNINFNNVGETRLMVNKVLNDNPNISENNINQTNYEMNNNNYNNNQNARLNNNYNINNINNNTNNQNPNQAPTNNYNNNNIIITNQNNNFYFNMNNPNNNNNFNHANNINNFNTNNFPNNFNQLQNNNFNQFNPLMNNTFQNQMPNMNLMFSNSMSQLSLNSFNSSPNCINQIYNNMNMNPMNNNSQNSFNSNSNK